MVTPYLAGFGIGFQKWKLKLGNKFNNIKCLFCSKTLFKSFEILKIWILKKFGSYFANLWSLINIQTSRHSYHVVINVFLYLGWQKIKIAMGEQILVLCGALKWGVAIVAKRRAPMAKPARVDHWVLAGTPWLKMV